MPGVLPYVNILGVKLTPIRMDELNQYIGRVIESGGKEPVNCINVHKVHLAHESAVVRKFLNDSNVVFADGAGVILGARMLGQRIAERIGYGDWIDSLCAFCAQRGYTMYFLGNRPGVAASAAEILTERHSGLKVVGTGHGYFNKTYGHPETEEVVRRINEANADIVLVGLGRPAQEIWLAENIHRLKTHVTLTGGGALDLVAGTLRRGPPWLVNHGFEWLARLFIEPRRLWRRYLIGNPLFILKMALQASGLKRYHVNGVSRAWMSSESSGNDKHPSSGERQKDT
jgi:N-acetylglucosaminyldiphosphoundecaprenol N-acetyl-beta-D-mannosaminyltransferase